MAPAGGDAVRVARCVEADVPALLAFEAAMALELGCPADDPRGAYDADWFSECCRGTFKRDNGHALPARTLVAWQGTRLVGGIMCYLDRARFTSAVPTARGGNKRRRATMQPFVELFWVYVAPAARKAKVGATLLAAALADTRQVWPEAERVRLHCIATNYTGLAFWTRMGFARMREVKAYPVEGMTAWRMERTVSAEGEDAALVPAGMLGVKVTPLDPLPRVVVICGVTGCGKSTIGKLLASRLGRSFLDADDFHPPANVAKMARGEALTDADREPWLATITAELARRVSTHGTPTVLACSALRAKYRKALRERLARPDVGFVLLQLEDTFETHYEELFEETGDPSHFLSCKDIARHVATFRRVTTNVVAVGKFMTGRVRDTAFRQSGRVTKSANTRKAGFYGVRLKDNISVSGPADASGGFANGFGGNQAMADGFGF